MEEQLNISLILRNFTDPSVIFEPTVKMETYSTLIDLNLTKQAIGPLQKYYLYSLPTSESSSSPKK